MREGFKFNFCEITVRDRRLNKQPQAKSTSEKKNNLTSTKDNFCQTNVINPYFQTKILLESDPKNNVVSLKKVNILPFQERKRIHPFRIEIDMDKLLLQKKIKEKRLINKSEPKDFSLPIVYQKQRIDFLSGNPQQFEKNINIFKNIDIKSILDIEKKYIVKPFKF